VASCDAARHHGRLEPQGLQADGEAGPVAPPLAPDGVPVIVSARDAGAWRWGRSDWKLVSFMISCYPLQDVEAPDQREHARLLLKVDRHRSTRQ
jgi:hypothetical protein